MERHHKPVMGVWHNKFNSISFPKDYFPRACLLTVAELQNFSVCISFSSCASSLISAPGPFIYFFLTSSLVLQAS